LTFYLCIEDINQPFPHRLAKTSLENQIRSLELLQKYTNQSYGGERYKQIIEVKDIAEKMMERVKGGKIPKDYPDDAWDISIASNALAFGFYPTKQLVNGFISPRDLSETLRNLFFSILGKYKIGERYLLEEHAPPKVGEFDYALLFILQNEDDFRKIEEKPFESSSQIYTDGGIENEVIEGFYSGWPQGFGKYRGKRKRPIIEVMREDRERGLSFDNKRSKPCRSSTTIASIHHLFI